MNVASSGVGTSTERAGVGTLGVRATRGEPPAGWDRCIADCGGPVFQSTAWARFVVAGNPTTIPWFLEFSDGATTIGYQLAFRHDRATLIKRVFTPPLWTEAMPVMRPERRSCLDAAVVALLEYARRSGDIEIVLGSYGDAGTSEILPTLGLAHRSRLEFPIALEHDPDVLLKSFSASRRQRIRAAERAGVVVEDLGMEEGAHVLRRLQAASAERIAGRGGPAYDPGSDGATEPLIGLVREGAARIVGARVGDTFESAGLFSLFDGRAYYVLSGHSSAGLKVQAPSALVWEMARRLRSEGCRELNLGGCGGDAVEPTSSEHGVYEFKRSFRGPIIECFSAHAVLRSGRYRTRQALRRLVRRD